MFPFQTPRTRAVFGTSEEMAAKTKVLAANQGLYNGFLAAGLIWSAWLGVLSQGRDIALFFLLCVLIAGLYGALTASRQILFVQALPSALGIFAILARL